jgi:hypothetical protein
MHRYNMARRGTEWTGWAAGSWWLTDWVEQYERHGGQRDRVPLALLARHAQVRQQERALVDALHTEQKEREGLGQHEIWHGVGRCRMQDAGCRMQHATANERR